MFLHSTVQYVVDYIGVLKRASGFFSLVSANRTSSFTVCTMWENVTVPYSNRPFIECFTFNLQLCLY
jgi:hypothetical protein